MALNATTLAPPQGFREPPLNIEAEQCLLGAILINNDAWREVAAFLKPEHFYEPVHRRLFAAMAREIGAGRLANDVMLWREFTEDEALRELDGSMYLRRLGRAAETIINARDYGQLIHDLACKRNLIALGEELVNRAYDPQTPASAADLLADVQHRVQAIEGETAATQAAPFEFIDHADIEVELPQRSFLVERWIPTSCVTSLYGSGGTGKSFLAMVLGMCVAAGRPWLRQYQCRRVNVMALMCEDDDGEIRRRRNQIAKALDIAGHEIHGRLFLSARVGDENALMTFPGGVPTRTALFTRTIAEARRLAVGLLILDNAAQLFAGNENDRAQVTAFLNAVAALARALDCAVLLLGHPPKVKGTEFSGSTAWDAVVRSRIWFSRANEENGNQGDRYTLELVKSNYAKRFGIELQVGRDGVVEYVQDIEQAGSKRKTTSDRTIDALADLYLMRRRAIALDELVETCIRNGIVNEAEPNTAAWRDRKRTVRSHLAKHRDRVDERGEDCFALKEL